MSSPSARKPCPGRHVHEVSRRSELGAGAGRRFERDFEPSDDTRTCRAATPGEPRATILLFELERLGGQRSSGPEIQPQAPSRIVGLGPHDGRRAARCSPGSGEEMGMISWSCRICAAGRPG